VRKQGPRIHNSQTCLDSEYELRERDIGMMSKDMKKLEISFGAILKLEPQKVSRIGSRSSTKFDGQSRSIVSCEKKSNEAFLLNMSISTTHEHLEVQGVR
jgi:hypothetical protein